MNRIGAKATLPNRWKIGQAVEDHLKSIVSGGEHTMSRYIGAVDLGTTSSRFILFDPQGQIVASDQREHRQIFPRPGWVEHDPMEIWQNSCTVIENTLKKAALTGDDVAAIGVTNQRETTVVWDKKSGRPFYNAIVWQCTRTGRICHELAQEGGPDRFKAQTGLPIAPYFSGTKLRWILDHSPGAQKAAQNGDALFGTIETWFIWWLTGGPGGGSHITDVTNASRTLLMNLRTLAWDEAVLEVLNIPAAMLPRIVPSMDHETWGVTLKTGPLGAEVPVCGALGDQQAALVGQACFDVGGAKNTYGTGCFMLLNTGETPVESNHGLLTTVGYQVRGEKPVYCLEGSVAIAGALVQWLRDNLGMIKSAPEIEALAKSVDDNGGVYIVPAFSGLFAPYWRDDARGVIAGLTHFANKGHLARAVLEASCYQTYDLMAAMEQDAKIPLRILKVDGGMVQNELLMQFQADILNAPVIRPTVTETTALGAAYAAGIAIGYWPDLARLVANWAEDKTWHPQMESNLRKNHLRQWRKAVTRSFDWVQDR